MRSAAVHTVFTDGVAEITINRPEALNAVDADVADGIAAAIRELESREDTVVGIITGAGDTFCSGMDLRAFASGELVDTDGGLAAITAEPPSKPLIAAVEGWALAGGFELALSADLIVAASDAKFGLPEVKRGMAAAATALLRLPKTLPYQLAMEMALTGAPVSAERASQFGMVNRLTAHGEALAGARELAAIIAANGPLAVQATKRVVSMAIRYTDPYLVAAESKHLDDVLSSRDAQEGARAFAERRTPQWQGR